MLAKPKFNTASKSEFELLTQDKPMDTAERLAFCVPMGQQHYIDMKGLEPLKTWLDAWVIEPQKNNWPNARQGKVAALYSLAKWAYYNGDKEEGERLWEMLIQKFPDDITLLIESHVPDKRYDYSQEVIAG